MTELIAFVFGLGLGLHYGPPLRQWALSKLKKDEPQPVMGGPIQPDSADTQSTKPKGRQ